MPNTGGIYLCVTLLINLPLVFTEGDRCGQPGRPVNGTASPTGSVYFPGEKVTYSCLEGFVLFGDEGRTCLKNGTWSGTVPLCDFNLAKGKPSLQSSTLWSYKPGLAVDGNRDTCSFTPKGPKSRWWQVHLGHKFNIVSIGVSISPGSFQEFTIFIIEVLSDNKALYKPCTEFKGVFETHKDLFKCNDGLGHPGQYVYIRDDRKEEQYFGLCEVEVFAFRERIPCGEPEVPLNGEVARESEGKALYTCHEGHKLEGDPALTCSSKGEWQGQTPKCEEVKCSAPSHVDNGFFEIGNQRGEYVFGTEATYGCSQGYTLKGAAVRVCGVGGKWSEEAPSCQAVNCGDPPTFENTKYIVLNGTSRPSGQKKIIVYTCVDGFKLLSGNEDTVTTCLDDGNWHWVNITCVPFTNSVDFIMRQTEGRSLDYSLSPSKSNSDTPHLVIALAVIAGILAAGMIVFGILLLRRRLLSNLGSLSPLVVRSVSANDTDSNAKSEASMNGVAIESPIADGKSNQTKFHTNILQSITQPDYRNNLNYSPNDTSATCLDSSYEPIFNEHSYETLRKKGQVADFEEEDSSSSRDTNYESVSSDKESVGYETVSPPKDLGYETVANGKDPGYDVIKDPGYEVVKDPGYEVVKERDLTYKDPGYETVHHEMAEPGYEIVRNDHKRSHGYETLKPKLPPRDPETELTVPDILQNLAAESQLRPYPGWNELGFGNVTGEIPAEILALYAKVDKSKKNRKHNPNSLPSTPPITANSPVPPNQQPRNETHPLSEAGGTEESQAPSKAKPKAKELVRKYNSVKTEEEEARSLSPQASLNSDPMGSLRGSLRPLPPLPR